MKHKIREKIFQEIWQKCKKIRETKGIDYSGKKDVNSNFKRVAQFLGITPEQALWVYYLKHQDAINTYIREGKIKQSESVEEKILDNINYLGILLSLIRENGNRKTNK